MTELEYQQRKSALKNNDDWHNGVEKRSGIVKPQEITNSQVASFVLGAYWLTILKYLGYIVALFSLPLVTSLILIAFIEIFLFNRFSK